LSEIPIQANQLLLRGGSDGPRWGRLCARPVEIVKAHDAE